MIAGRYRDASLVGMRRQAAVATGEENYAKFLEKSREILDTIECDRILIDLPFSTELKENIPKLFGKHKSTKIIAFDFFDYNSEFIDKAVGLRRGRGGRGRVLAG